MEFHPRAAIGDLNLELLRQLTAERFWRQAIVVLEKTSHYGESEKIASCTLAKFNVFLKSYRRSSFRCSLEHSTVYQDLANEYFSGPVVTR